MPIVAEYIGTRLTAANLITGSGILRAFLVSHVHKTDVHTLTFYDNTAASGTVLIAIHIQPLTLPFFLKWSRDDALRFSTGLSATYSDLEVNVWAVQLT